MSSTISRVLSWMIIFLDCMSPYSSPISPIGRGLPGNMTGRHTAPLFGLASDGVYTASTVTGEAVVSYTAIPPLPPEGGGFFSVALSLGSPPPDVIRHPALRSPDFPHMRPFITRMRDHPCCSQSLILSRLCSVVKFVTL